VRDEILREEQLGLSHFAVRETIHSGHFSGRKQQQYAAWWSSVGWSVGEMPKGFSDLHTRHERK